MFKSNQNFLFQTPSINNNVNRNYNNNMFPSQETMNKPKEMVKVLDQDPFIAANVNTSLNQPIDNFANFDNNPIFDSVSSNFVTGKKFLNLK